MNFKTEQEKFWAGDFGDEYIGRNKSEEYLASNLNFFSKAFNQLGQPKSIIEFGANIGMNLRAIKLLFPTIDLFGIEINKNAADELAKFIGKENVFNGSIFEFEATHKCDVSLIKGVLIHINPDMLSLVYEKLYTASNKYILICGCNNCGRGRFINQFCSNCRHHIQHWSQCVNGWACWRDNGNSQSCWWQHS